MHYFWKKKKKTTTTTTKEKKKYSVASQATMFRRELNLPGTCERSSSCLYQKSPKKQSAMPKINWNKAGKVNQCMDNTQKE